MATVQCTISFTDGEQLRVQWDRPEDAAISGSSMIDAALSKESVAIELEGRLVVIPTQNIRTIQISPAPEKLPQTVIRGARMM